MTGKAQNSAAGFLGLHGAQEGANHALQAPVGAAIRNARRSRPPEPPLSATLKNETAGPRSVLLIDRSYRLIEAGASLTIARNILSTVPHGVTIDGEPGGVRLADPFPVDRPLKPEKPAPIIKLHPPSASLLAKAEGMGGETASARPPRRPRRERRPTKPAGGTMGERADV